MPLLLAGSFNSARAVSASAVGSLAGHRRVYIIGTITDFSKARIEIRPAFIGVRSFIEEEDGDQSSVETRLGLRVYPEEISQFDGIDFRSPVTPADLRAVLLVPEETVKHAIADLIGEAYVPKDWAASAPTCTHRGSSRAGSRYPARGSSKAPGTHTR